MLYFMLVGRVEEQEQEEAEEEFRELHGGTHVLWSQGLGGSTSLLSGSEQYLCGDFYVRLAA